MLTEQFVKDNYYNCVITYLHNNGKAVNTLLIKFELINRYGYIEFCCWDYLDLQKPSMVDLMSLTQQQYDVAQVAKQKADIKDKLISNGSYNVLNNICNTLLLNLDDYLI